MKKQPIKPKYILILFCLTQIVYFSMLFHTIPVLHDYSDNTKIPDLKPAGYDSSYVLILMDKLGVEGRDYYLHTQIPIDMIYPILFALSFSLTINYFLRKLKIKGQVSKLMSYVPIVAGTFDIFENFFVMKMINTFPTIPKYVVDFGSMITLMKSLFTTMTFFCVFGLLFSLSYKWINSHNH